MSVQIGDRLPEGKFFILTDDGLQTLSTGEVFANKKVVFFGVPGAFTSTCSNSHLPGFLKRADEIREKGVDTIACMAVNDAAVMRAWGTDRGVGDAILLLADGNCDYARALGLDFDSSAFGSGMRSRRFAMIVDDGVVTHMAVDEPGKFEVTRAERVLEAL